MDWVNYQGYGLIFVTLWGPEVLRNTSKLMTLILQVVYFQILFYFIGLMFVPYNWLWILAYSFTWDSSYGGKIENGMKINDRMESTTLLEWNIIGNTKQCKLNIFIFIILIVSLAQEFAKIKVHMYILQQNKRNSKFKINITLRRKLLIWKFSKNFLIEGSIP